MTTKSPTSTCGAYWGLCLPRSRIAVWLASRPSTTSVASMTCQARATSPGLGVYVRTALVSSVVVGKAGGSPHRERETVQRARDQPARAPADHDTSRPEADSRPSGDLAEPPRRHVVDSSPHLGGQQVRRLPYQPERLPDVGVDVGERAGGPGRPVPGGRLHEVGEILVGGLLQPA